MNRYLRTVMFFHAYAKRLESETTKKQKEDNDSLELNKRNKYGKPEKKGK